MRRKSIISSSLSEMHREIHSSWRFWIECSFRTPETVCSSLAGTVCLSCHLLHVAEKVLFCLFVDDIKLNMVLGIVFQVMLDTVGPELQVANKSEKAISLQADATVILTPDQGQEATSDVLPINFSGLSKVRILPKFREYFNLFLSLWHVNHQ